MTYMVTYDITESAHICNHGVVMAGINCFKEIDEALEGICRVARELHKTADAMGRTAERMFENERRLRAIDASLKEANAALRLANWHLVGAHLSLKAPPSRN